MRHSAPFVFALGAVAVLSACTGSPAPDVSASGREHYQLYLDRAVAHEVSPDQIAVLEAATQTGELTFEQLSGLMDQTFACFDAAGIDYEVGEPWENPPGRLLPNFSYLYPLDGGADGIIAVADACQVEHFEIANEAYQTQPSVAELVDAALLTEKDEVLACLAQRGIPLSDDATLDEIKQAVLQDVLDNDGALDYFPCSEWY